MCMYIYIYIHIYIEREICIIYIYIYIYVLHDRHPCNRSLRHRQECNAMIHSWPHSVLALNGYLA